MSSIFDDIKSGYKIGGISEKLIYWNIGAFIISLVFFYQFSIFNFSYPDWLQLSSNTHSVIFYPWTLLSYAFLHGSFWHLFFNMVLLYFSSRLFLTFFTEKQLLGMYLLSAIFAGIVFVILFNVLGYKSSMVGASGAIMAILVATTTYSPLMNIRIFVWNVRLWHFTAIVLILDIMEVALNTGGHIAHLAGAFFGFLYIKLLQNGTDLSKIVTNVLNFFTNIFKPGKSKPFKKVHTNYAGPAISKPVSRIITKDKAQQQIDEILDKISRSGYDSLTKEEKEFLFKAGK